MQTNSPSDRIHLCTVSQYIVRYSVSKCHYFVLLKLWHVTDYNQCHSATSWFPETRVVGSLVAVVKHTTAYRLRIDGSIHGVVRWRHRLGKRTCQRASVLRPSPAVRQMSWRTQLTSPIRRRSAEYVQWQRTGSSPSTVWDKSEARTSF